jgi:hypothetical protein
MPFFASTESNVTLIVVPSGVCCGGLAAVVNALLRKPSQRFCSSGLLPFFVSVSYRS